MRRVVVLLLIAVVILLLPDAAYADDGIDKNGVCFCTGIWPAKLSDGISATDWRFMGNSSWPKNRVIYQYEPIKIEYVKFEEAAVSPVVESNAPAGLDNTQAIRWHQALPWAKWYLARLWGIDEETARQYGAR